ncbi:MAG: hypothetical protein LUG51_11615, partial [Tannerellaceae bacterium]|nr:hypothetical protein [Tannerellaceae bacterium]
MVTRREIHNSPCGPRYLSLRKTTTLSAEKAAFYHKKTTVEKTVLKYANHGRIYGKKDAKT